MDCADGEYGNQGCNGGLPAYAYLYSDDNYIELAIDYPYTGAQADCKSRESLGKVSADGF